MKKLILTICFCLIASTAWAGLTAEKVSPQETPEKFYFYNESTKKYDVEKLQLSISANELYKTRYKSKSGYQDLIKTNSNEFKLYENDVIKATARWLLYVNGKESVIDYSIVDKKQSIYIDDNRDKKVCWEITFPYYLEDDYAIPVKHYMETNGVIIDWTDFEKETKTEVKDGKLLIWFYPKETKIVDIDPTLTVSTEATHYRIISDDTTNKYQIDIFRTQAALVNTLGKVDLLGDVYSPDWSSVTAVGHLTGGFINVPTTGGWDYKNAASFSASLDINTTEVAQTSQGSNFGQSGTNLDDGSTDVTADTTYTFFPTKVVGYVEVDLKAGVDTSDSSPRGILGIGNREGQGPAFTDEFYSAINGTETSRRDVALTTNEDYAWTNATTGDVFDFLAIRTLNIPVEISGGNSTTRQFYEHSYISSSDAFYETIGNNTIISGVFFYVQEYIFEQTTTEAEREGYAWDIRNPLATAITGTLATTANYVSNGYDTRYGWYEVAAATNVATLEFDDKRGGATSYTYYNTPIKVTSWTDASNPTVEKSTDDGGSWAELTEDTDYIITDEADESEVGSNVRIFQLLGTMSGTGGTANHLRFSTGVAAGRTRRFF